MLAAKRLWAAHWALALLYCAWVPLTYGAAKAAGRAVAGPVHRCAFVDTQPRYYVLEAQLRVVAAAKPNTFMNDAVLRTVTEQLGADPCQVELAQGERCSAAEAQLPCTDPLWVCGGDLTLSNTLYQAARSGACSRNGTAAAAPPAVCAALAGHPAMLQLVQPWRCKPDCYAHTSSREAAREEVTARPDLANASCFAFSLAVQQPSEQAAAAAGSKLGSATMQGALEDALAPWSAANSPPVTVVGDPVVHMLIGFGSFPPPPPPPSPKPPVPPPPSPAPSSPVPAPPLLPFVGATTSGRPSTSGGRTGNSPTPAGATPQEGATPVLATLVFGDWGDCSASCGCGWQTRQLYCVAHDGSLLDVNLCKEAEGAKRTRDCIAPSCNAPYWTYTPWTSCTAKCGGGTAKRTAKCSASKGASCSTSSGPTSTVCHTAPCQAYAWSVGEWQTCNSACGGGQQSRSVACVDSGGSTAADTRCAAATKPPSTQRCNMRACDFCSGNSCFGHGSCSSGTCTCDPALRHSGQYCQVPVLCSSGVVDAQLRCCASGLVSSGGGCCPAGSILDGRGTCCAAGVVDACGVCGGKGQWVDVQGTCCSTMLDAGGICCQSGVVDECGVCDGVSDTCSVQMQLGLSVSPSVIHSNGVETQPIEDFVHGLVQTVLQVPGDVSMQAIRDWTPSTSAAVDPAGGPAGQGHATRRLLAPVTAPVAAPAVAPAAGSRPQLLTVGVTIAPNASGWGQFKGQLNAGWMEAALQDALASGQPASSAVWLASVPHLGRTSVCGNGVCEMGERTIGATLGSCPQDCGFASQFCPDAGCGKGNCVATSGKCQCWAGYSGDACESCAPGYQPIPNGCMPDVVALGLALPPLLRENITTNNQGYSEPIAPEQAPLEQQQQQKDSVNVAAIVLGTLGGLAVVLVAIALLLLARWHRSRRNAQLESGSSGDVEDSCDAISSVLQSKLSSGTLGHTGATSKATQRGGSPVARDSMIVAYQPSGRHSSRQQQQQSHSGMQSSRHAVPSLPTSGRRAAGSNPPSLRRSEGSPPVKPVGGGGGRSNSVLQPSRRSRSPPLAEDMRQASGTETANSTLSLAVLGAAGLHSSSLSREVVPALGPASLRTLPSPLLMGPQLPGGPPNSGTRMFYNPEFSTEDGVAMRSRFSSFVGGASRIPRLASSLPQPPSIGAAAPALPSERAAQGPSTDTGARKERLQLLRAAVEALEADVLEAPTAKWTSVSEITSRDEGAEWAAPARALGPQSGMQRTRPALHSSPEKQPSGLPRPGSMRGPLGDMLGTARGQLLRTLADDAVVERSKRVRRSGSIGVPDTQPVPKQIPVLALNANSSMRSPDNTRL